MLLPEGSAIFKIALLYYDEEKPVCISNIYIPEYIFPELTTDILSSSPSIDKIISNCQFNISKSNQKIVLVYANEYETTLLKVTPGSPLMKYKGLMYDKQGHLTIFFENIMLIDYFGFYDMISIADCIIVHSNQFLKSPLEKIYKFEEAFPVTVGIICEYNPLHLGHQKQIHRIREVFGEETTIVCAMSEDRQASMCWATL